MIRRFARLAALALVLAAGTAGRADAQYPAEPGTGVADLANVLSQADADSIRALLYALRESPGVEVRVLTVRSVGQYGTGAATPEAFATGVYNEWKLGLGQEHDGVLVMLSVDDRFTRIELGDEVPASQDARMRAIVDDVMVPRFRDGDMSGGLRDGVGAIARALRTLPAAPATPLPAAGPAAAQPARAPASGEGGGSVLGGLIFLAVMAGLGYFAVRGIARLVNRKRKCEACHAPMLRLEEQADDVFLDSGRRVEEVLGSVNYDVWHCAGCGQHQIVRRAAWFSGKQDCPQCRYKTVNVNRTVLQSATYDHGGREQVDKQCGHCGWQDVDVVHTPRIPRPSPSSSRRSSFSSSGSSRSSSGGGSSGGSRGGHSSGRGSSGRW